MTLIGKHAQFTTQRLRSPGLWIFVVALVVRLVWISTLPSALSWGDESDYVTIARGLLRGEGYVSSSLRANPGFPVFLTLIFGAFGEQLVAARVAQCLLGALTCFLLYRIGGRLVSPTAGTIGGAYLAIYPPHIYLPGVIYTESLVTFLCALSVYLAVCSVEERPRLALGLLAGIVLGMTTLTRSTFAVFVPCVCLAWLYGARHQWPKYLPLCGVFLVGSAATILPWIYRNYRVYHRLIPVSTGFQTLLWRGNTPLTRGGPDDRDLMWNSPEWQQRLQELPEAERSALARQYAAVDRKVREREAELHDVYLATDEVLGPLAVRYVVSNPLRTLVLAFKKLGTMYSAFSKTATHNVHTTGRYKLIAALTYYPMLVLALLGAALGLPRRRELALAYLLVGSVSMAYALLVTSTRYRLPLDPYLILFASVTLAHALSGKRMEITTSTV